MKINDELLFFMIKSRLFAPLSFSLPPSVEGGASTFLSLLEQAGCALAHLSSPVPLPDQHPSAAPSTCLLLGLETSHSGSLNCCRISLQNDMTSEGTLAFCYGSTKLFCPHHPSRGPSCALHGCTGKLSIWMCRSRAEQPLLESAGA